MANKFNAVQTVEPDGLITPEIGNWSEKKYNLLGRYCGIFTKAMKDKWNLVYIDLFAGAGYAKIRETGATVKNCALVAMTTEKAFDFHLFNELDKEKYEALVARSAKHCDGRRHKVLNLDTNADIESIMAEVPTFNNGKGRLMFCFLDPFSLALHYDTIKALAKHKVDFLILLALQMAAKRNFHNYINEENETISRFIGNPDWRKEFDKTAFGVKDFTRFLASQYDDRFQKLGYHTDVEKEQIATDTGLKLYYLAFYSRNDLGSKFFKAVKKASNDQFTLGL